MSLEYQEISDRLVDLEVNLKKEIKGIRMDLLQLAVTAVVILGLMENGVEVVYSVLIGALGGGVVRIIYDRRNREAAKYRENSLREYRESRNKNNK